MDLKAQYEQLMRSELRSLGCNRQFTDDQLKKKDKRDSSLTSNIQDYELSLLSNLFYSIIHRLFVQKPRQIIKYPEFDDKGNAVGIANLERKIVNGESLIPHLSKLIFDTDQSSNNDPMLNEWSIHHFHIPPNDGNGTFVTRSSDLLFAIVTEDQFIFLDVQPHSDSTGTYEPWIDVGIIEKIEEHYPTLLEQHYIGDGRTPLTQEQRKALRSKNDNTNIITTCGKEYRTPGFGSVAAGLPVSSIIKGDRASALIESLPAEPAVQLKFDTNYNLVAEI